jgi:hypothetical protein
VLTNKYPSYIATDGVEDRLNLHPVPRQIVAVSTINISFPSTLRSRKLNLSFKIATHNRVSAFNPLKCIKYVHQVIGLNLITCFMEINPLPANVENMVISE